MSSSDLAISVRGLSKAYTIRHQDEKHITLAEQALARLRHPLRRPERETFWALDDVSFDVKKGEVLGVIGRNGAGKSTLLKVLSRITAPTKGEVRLYGRVGSLLEVGTGFHPELTGRENVYLNGSILGMKTKEIDKQFDAIVDFAGVEKFLDTPVKRYSSGMYVRLAFAVAAHLETEILLLDEVLAVGDAEFQKKCLGKIGEVRAGGRTVLLVTHQIKLVEQLTERALLLDGGRLCVHGGAAEAAEQYFSAAGSARPENNVEASTRPNYALSGLHRLRTVRCEVLRFDSAAALRVHCSFCSETAAEQKIALVVHVNRAGTGEPVGTAILPEIKTSDSQCQFDLDITGLAHGQYTITTALTSPNPGFGHTNHDVVENAVTFELLNPFVNQAEGVPHTWGSVRFPILALDTTCA